jgi:hypothetical protein
MEDLTILGLESCSGAGEEVHRTRVADHQVREAVFIEVRDRHRFGFGRRGENPFRGESTRRSAEHIDNPGVAVVPSHHDKGSMRRADGKLGAAVGIEVGRGDH